MSISVTASVASGSPAVSIVGITAASDEKARAFLERRRFLAFDSEEPTDGTVP